MTEQYLAGELSLLLARLQAVNTSQTAVRDLARLRYEAETCPLPALGSVVVRALALADGLCWNSLSRGDVQAFTRQAEAGEELCRFGVCASLLGEA